MPEVTSNFLTLNIKDFLKGLIITMGSAIFALIAESIQQGQFSFNFTTIWHTGVAAGVTYLGKQLFTSSKIILPFNNETK